MASAVKVPALVAAPILLTVFCLPHTVCRLYMYNTHSSRNLEQIVKAWRVAQQEDSNARFFSAEKIASIAPAGFSTYHELSRVRLWHAWTDAVDDWQPLTIGMTVYAGFLSLIVKKRSRKSASFILGMTLAALVACALGPQLVDLAIAPSRAYVGDYVYRQDANWTDQNRASDEIVAYAKAPFFGHRAVAYADGHVTDMDEVEFQPLMAELGK